MHAEEYQERTETVGDFEIHIVTYRLGETWHCKVDNVSPGALIARGTGTTREDAEMSTVELARQRVAATRIQTAE